MKLRHFIAAAVLIAPIPFIGMTSAATAASQHIVFFSGQLRVFDDSLKWVEEQFTTPPQNLKHTGPTSMHFKMVRCAAGATRGELQVWASLLNNNDLFVTTEVRLFEGTSCGTTDQEGYRHHEFTVPQGGTRSRVIIVNNGEAYDDDYLRADVTVTNRVVRALITPPPGYPLNPLK